MLSVKINNRITLIAYATVSNLFAMFHNPKMRGENFSWDKFPDLCERRVDAQVFMEVVIKNSTKQKEAQEYAKKIGREIAVSLLKEMTSE